MPRYSFPRAACALALALLLPAATALAHGPYQHQNSYEIRDQSVNKSPGASGHTPQLVIDTFQNPTHNDLGFWHGAGENLTMVHQPGLVRLFPTDPDQNFHTQFDTHGCFSLLPWHKQFLHVVFEGTDQFTVSLNEHNAECYPRRAPFPGVADSVQASRYALGGRSGNRDEDVSDDEGADSALSRKRKEQPQRRPTSSSGRNKTEGQSATNELFVPLSHFKINHNRVVSVSFTGFYTNQSLTLHRVEIVPAVPQPTPENNHFKIPEKLPSGKLILRCSRPNSFAFGIDDGQPQFAQEVMRILDEQNVRVTFFTVGAGLSDVSTNFTNFYKEMIQKGHQVALHSNTHPK